MRASKVKGLRIASRGDALKAGWQGTLPWQWTTVYFLGTSRCLVRWWLTMLLRTVKLAVVAQGDVRHARQVSPTTKPSAARLRLSQRRVDDSDGIGRSERPQPLQRSCRAFHLVDDGNTRSCGLCLPSLAMYIPHVSAHLCFPLHINHLHLTSLTMAALSSNSCPAGYSWYTCVTGNYAGCCAVDACDYLDGCPASLQLPGME